MKPILLTQCMMVAATVWLADAAAAVDALVTAVAGEPFGVATIELPVEPPLVGRELPPLQARSESGRVLYPSAEVMRTELPRAAGRPIPQPRRGRLLNRIGNLIREVADQQQPLYQTTARRVSFLFVGRQPIRVQILDSRGEIGTYDVQPEQNPAAHAETLQRWWAAYTAGAQRQIEAADYPVLVESYLVAMLAGRLQLPLPDWYGQSGDDDNELTNTLKLIGGAKATSDAIFRQAAIGSASAEEATVPLPPPPAWAASFAQAGLSDVPVEPMAERVPADCFYIRYGSFENFLWFRDLSNEYGGDISRMITLRGIKNQSFANVESQLNVQTSEISRMLGPQVVEDQALIGRDLYLQDGASFGVLFKAKNKFLLRTSLTGERSTRARIDDAVTLQQVEVAGHSVSLLSSADNRVRSFMAEDQDFFLITNSRAMVESFYQTGRSGESLAATPAFRLSRKLMPLERNDTIFAYFSPAMLRGLVAPRALIELRRRLFAKADIALVHLARLAAAQELQRPVEGIDELIARGFLPDHFGSRADGSGVVSVGAELVDTLRGSRGSFLPIADVAIDNVTPTEARWYQNIAQYYSEKFPAIDPIMAGIQRESIGGDEDEQVQRVSIHVEVAPWSPEKYGRWATQLGPPTNVAMQFAPDDIVAVQAHVASPQLGPPTHLFAAIKDTVPPDPDDFDGLLNIYRSLRGLPGYLGAWPQPGALDRLPFGIGQGRPVGPGRSRLIGGLYRYTDGQYSLLSFQPEVIESALQHLSSAEVDDTAQIRARIGNLRGSHIEDWANQQLYARARIGSVAGADFLGLLTRQLSVDPAVAQQSASQILGAELQCPLGGEYQFAEGANVWSSAAWSGVSPADRAPQGYEAPVMKWFRGATARLTQYQDRVVADLSVDIARTGQRAVAP